ncbi:hypothetical protein LCGC14_0342900 [marine sediment metagenome]|uniref:Uncharacterized protein n=1 Tax=marine sediment metagenome TaxID=412755 RepID=A0A0F9TVW8_9ZZZZ
MNKYIISAEFVKGQVMKYNALQLMKALDLLIDDGGFLNDTSMCTYGSYRALQGTINGVQDNESGESGEQTIDPITLEVSDGTDSEDLGGA